MRATEFVTEVFQPGKQNWDWRRRTDDEATAEFTAGNRNYVWQAFLHNHRYGAQNRNKWEIQFRLIREITDPGDLDLFGNTGTGNSAEVMSTAVDITRAFLKYYGDTVQEITFNAKQDKRNSRIALYARMVNRLLPDWNLEQEYSTDLGLQFNLSRPKQM